MFSDFKKLPLHFKILVGIIIGIMWGIFSVALHWPEEITLHYIKPFGEIFIRLLKMVAVPLVMVSLVLGIISVQDIRSLSRIGGKTIGMYLFTTVIAISLGLLLVNIIKPGKNVDPGTLTQVEKVNESDEALKEKKDTAHKQQEAMKKDGPLQTLVDIVPENVFSAFSNNSSMLQVVFFAMLMGVAMVMLPSQTIQPIQTFFNAFNEVLIKIIHIIMYFSPFGAFALIASVIVEIKSFDLLYAVLAYTGTVLFGLLLLIFVVYPAFFMSIAKINYKKFFLAIREAHILAFSTRSSSATLPVTMEKAENNLGVSKEVSGFVLPLGATINMDGTSLYQAVAAVFIAQVYGQGLDFSEQLMILLTALLASIGTAGVPSAGIVMLVIVLSSAGIPEAGLALIYAPDQILDMFRTVVNVTGDVTVATSVAASEGHLNEPMENIE